MTSCPPNSNLSPLKKRDDTMTLQITHFENGIKKVKLKQSESERIEGIKLKLNHKQPIIQTEKKFAMPEFQVMTKKKIWKDKLTHSKINLSDTELLKILDQDLISKEKVLMPFWNQQSKEISKKLLLPTEIDYADLDLNSLSQSLKSTMGESWFSMMKTNLQIKNSLKMSFPSSQSFLPNYMAGEVVEIKETKDKTWSFIDKEKVEYKSLKFKLFPNEEQKSQLHDIASQQKWIWNACVNVFNKENNLSDLKKKLDIERETIKEYNSKLSEANKIKDKVLKEKTLKSIFNSKPKKTKFDYKKYRDNLRKYKYTETEFGKTTDGKDIVLTDFEYNEENDSFPIKEDWFDIKHNRIPRGSVFGFISSLNSNIANYRNNERDFSLNLKTSKQPKETIYFEDKCYPSLINNIRNKYCYTKIINGQKKRLSLTLTEIKKNLNVQSITIVYEKNTDKFYLNLSVPIDFYLPNDKRSESQASFSDGSMISLDPGIRTFIMGYAVDKTYSFGDGCSEEIFKLLLHCDRLIITKDMTNEEKYKMGKEKQEIRNRIKCMVEDMHWKIIKYLISNYQVIIYPDFQTLGMMKKLSKENKRKLSAFSFNKFKQRLIYKCKTNKNVLIVTNEAYTSRTCCSCGFLNPKSSNKTFECNRCKYKIDRDINGSRNIMIKTLSILQPKNIKS